ncbi:MAG: MaoC family dehydratase N-terminal domain-containing protein [Acidobacteria bacterium]|nr:MaoC family dehydratase N-terminal domain-containing protein [Acidobacteriota bacterium]
MPINPDAVGTTSQPVESSWTSREALLYAVGVGAGQDPLDRGELPFVTENSIDVEQRALPTFAVVLPDVTGVFGSIGSFNPAMLVHGEERIVLHRELPVEGAVTTTAEITAIWDKGKGAVVEITSRSLAADGGEPLFDVVMSAFIRGEGGWGGERGPSGGAAIPEGREPDTQIDLQTRPEQALVYRLSGDRNPLHSDPAFAALAGFDRPILHGLCTYGFSGRALLRGLCDGDPARLASMSGRFSSPVFPGESLTVQIWRTASDEAVYRTLGADGRVVIDAGTATTRA